MICPNCNSVVDDNSIACSFCGTPFVSGGNETTVLDQSMVYNAAPSYSQPQYSTPMSFSRPMIQFPTDRGILKFILLSLVTFGIYGMVTFVKMIGELNIAASRYDGQKTMDYMAMCFVAPLTLGIYVFVWFHKLSNRIGAEVRRRGYEYNFGAKDFWLWYFLGSMIIVGPFIYVHKMFKAMNMINESFNIYG